MKTRRLSTVFAILFFGIFLMKIPVHAQDYFEVKGTCTEANKATLEIDLNTEVQIDGLDIYRGDLQSGEYQYVDNILVDEWDYYYSDYYSYDTPDLTFTDPAVLIAYRYYNYRIQAYRYEEVGYYDEEDDYDTYEVKTYVQTKDVNVYIVGAGPIITSGKRSGKNAAKLKWKSVDNADGYYIYCIKDINKQGEMIYPDIYNESAYTLVKTIKNKKTLSAIFKKLDYGVTYTYRIYAYKNVNGKRVRSVSSELISVPMDYYAYWGESYTARVKRAFGSEKKKNKNFKTEKKARKQMKTIKIKVWDYKNGKKGKKVTKIKYLTVNKNLAPTIQQMFKDIYNSKEKQVIHDIGCYSYRTGEHMYGLAIDVNPNENYMIDGIKILSGKYWKPKKDPYSIPNDSDFVRIMARYGFYRGLWGIRRDYMHFSYFGT